MGSTSPFSRLSDWRHGLLALLLVVYSAAQLFGVAHAASHHRADQGGAHAGVCALCVAAAESGGGPTDVPRLSVAPTWHLFESVPAVTIQVAFRSIQVYRSRAPPVFAGK